jgi:hypothetical protein
MADEDFSRAEYQRQYYQKNKDRISAVNRAWREANKDVKAASDRAYAQANKERIAARKLVWQRESRKNNPQIVNDYRNRNIESYRAREAAYRERNREVCNERVKEWKKRNPHATVVYAGRRRAAEVQAIPAWADLDAIAAIYKQARSFGPGYHVDHAVPLIGDSVCGFHCEANLQIIPAAENLRKNKHRWPDMW